MLLVMKLDLIKGFCKCGCLERSEALQKFKLKIEKSNRKAKLCKAILVIKTFAEGANNTMYLSHTNSTNVLLGKNLITLVYLARTSKKGPTPKQSS